jgi:phosphoketolase
LNIPFGQETNFETDLGLLDRYWRAANYLSVGQIYLLDNPLLREPLRPEHIKPRLLGHWGTTPGLNFIYAHLNRLIRARDLDMIFICGPGHGGPGMVANTYLEGTYSEIYPDITRDTDGLRKLTGRHGLFNCYEAFVHIVDSMFNQHAKWLEVSRQLPWRRPIASLNYLLSSHVWRQDHNGFSHQDPGFVDLVANKDADIVRIYFPPDANSLLWVTDHCLRTYDRINVIVAGKQPAPQWLSMSAAEAHCEAGIGIWAWAGNEGVEDPDVVMACAGDVPTLETLAAVSLLHDALPDLKIRVVNVVDL